MDSRPTTHKVQLECPSVENLHDIFDTITYAKGSVCCRMLASFCGEKFHACLKVYFSQYAWGNATSQDLLKVCDQIVGSLDGVLPSEFLGAWLTQTGFPVLKVSVESGPDNSLIFTLTQRPFRDYPQNEPGCIWPLLLNMIDEEGNQKRLMMKEGELKFESDRLWWFNHQQQGFYLCEYSSHDEFQRLCDSLHERKGFKQDHYSIFNSAQIFA